MFGDDGELTLAAAINGVAHPPGYPLWIAIAHVFSLLPLGTIPFRVGLFSAVSHACTIGIVCAAGILLTRNVLGGFFAGALLGCAPLFVTWSIQPEVFALNDLIVSGIFFCCVLLSVREGGWWLFVVVCGLLGLGLSNQQTIVALAPLLLWVLWCKRFELPARREGLVIGALAVLALALGFVLPYIHTLVVSQRELAWPFQTARDLPQLVSLITRKLYGAGNLVAGGPLAGGTFSSRFGATLVALWPVLPAVVLGGLLSGGESNVRLWFPAIWALAISVIFCIVANVNVENAFTTAVFTRFALLPMTLLAPYAAFVVSRLQWMLRKRPAVANVAGIVLVAGVLAGGLANAQTRSLHDRHDARTLVNNVFATVPRGAVLLSWAELYDQTIPYFQTVEGLRPDVTSVILPLVPRGTAPDYEALLERQGVTVGQAPAMRTGVQMRDALVDANPARAIYIVGSGALVRATAYNAYKLGLTALLSKHAASGAIASNYRRSAAAMASPDYGAVSIDAADTTGFGPYLAFEYGDAYYSMGMYAKSVRRAGEARRWLERALRYLPGDPRIQEALQ